MEEKGRTCILIFPVFLNCFVFPSDKRHSEVEGWMSQSCHQAVFHAYFLKFEMTLKVENLKKEKKKKKEFFTELSVHLCHNLKRRDIFLTASGEKTC